ncbi:MAG: Ig-like domain-containing protein, partial [Propionibacteriaceae bacterium]|nr:Ig-like domain-containing protein [Propionibacteriaceae bacterium]
PVGTAITATATIRDAGGQPLAGIPVTFGNASAPVTTLTSATGAGCVTGSDGTCGATITSATAGRYVDELSATVVIHGTTTPVAGSPQTVTFTAGELSVTRSTFTVTPVAEAGDRETWVTADGTSAYTGTLTARDGHGNPLVGLTLGDIVFTASSTDVVVSAVVDRGDGTYTVTYTSVVAAASPAATVAYQATAVGTALPIPFKAGEPVVGPVICTDPDRQGTNLWVAPASLPVGEWALATALITDELCNPVPGATVSFAVDGSAGLSTGPWVTGTDGVATAQVTDTVAETVNVTATITAGRVHGSPAPVKFTEGGFSWSQSTFAVSPVVSLADRDTWVVADGTSAYTGTLTARDSNGNPLSALALADFAFTASGQVQVSQVTNAGGGAYQVTYTSVVADASPVAQAAYQAGAVGTALPVPFRAGEPVVGPVECPDPDLTGSHLAADRTTLPVGETANLTALVTDRRCNAVTDVPVTFALPPGSTALLAVTSAVTDAQGYAYATVTSTQAQTVPVSGRIAAGELDHSPLAVTFTTGGFSWLASTFTVTPGADLADDSTWVVADGAAAYTATLRARDANDNPLTGLAVADIAFAASSGSVIVSAVTNAGDGTYTATYTSTVAQAAPVASVAYQTVAVGAKLPVPFRAGDPVVGPVDCEDGKGTHLTALPARLGVGGSATATALITDELCNPVPGVTVSFGSDGASTLSAASQVTGRDGIAQVQVTDAVAELVAVTATIPVGGSPSALDGSPAPVEFTAGAVDARTSGLGVDPVTQTVGAPVTITVTARDAGSNPVTGLTAHDIVVAGRADSRPDLALWGFQEVAPGRYTYTATSKLVGDFTVSAVVTGVTLGETARVTFTAGGVCVNNCTPENPDNVTRFEMDRNDQLADGAATDTAVAYAFDTYGNPVVGASVVARDQTTGALAGLLAPATATATTGADGTATLAWTSTKAGVFTAEGTIDGLRPATGVLAAIRFTIGTAQAANSDLVVTPVSPIAAGHAYTATVTVRDASGHLVPDAAVAFRL